MENHRPLRSILAKTISLLVLIFLLLFVYILFRGMTWAPSQQKQHFSEIGLGETQLVTFQGKRLWTTRLSKQQRKLLSSLDESVHPATQHQTTQEKWCKLQSELCLVISQTKQFGIIIRHIDSFPDSLPADQPWLSGFVNPLNGAVYDLLGRGYLSNPSDAPNSIVYELSKS